VIFNIDRKNRAVRTRANPSFARKTGSRPPEEAMNIRLIAMDNMIPAKKTEQALVYNTRNLLSEETGRL
jgi:hypothetical protein